MIAGESWSHTARLVLCSTASFSSAIVTCCFAAGDAAKYRHAGQTVKGESACGFSARVESRNHLAVNIDDLALRVDLQAGKRVVQYRCRPCGIERRFLNFVHRRRLAEVGIFSSIN